MAARLYLSRLSDLAQDPPENLAKAPRHSPGVLLLSDLLERAPYWLERVGRLADALFDDPAVQKALTAVRDDGQDKLLKGTLALALVVERCQSARDERSQVADARSRQDARWKDLADLLERVEDLLSEVPRAQWVNLCTSMIGMEQVPPLPVDLQFDLGPYFDGRRLLGEVTVAREALKKHVTISRRPRGGQRDEARHRLARNVALVLRLNELPVKKSRGGLFAAVLCVCLDAAGAERPVEMWRLIGPAVDEVR